VTQVVFPPYGSSTTAAYGASFVTDVAAIRRSPYARAYALVRRLTRGTRTPYDYVSRVERYLSGANGFRYDENPARSRYPLAAFLFGSRHGYCQQFAGTMALLLRMGGVPARVATGFTSGTYDDATRSWVVTDTDAHAWVEAWFPRFGWVRFDPTPYAAPARGGHLSLPSIGGAGGIGAAATPGKHGLSRGAGGSGSSPTSHRAGSGVGGPLVLAIVLALAAVALLATIRLRDPTAEEVLGELERAFRRCRRPLGSAMTLAALEQRLRGDPDAQAYVRDLRLARFAGVAWQPSGAGRRALRAHLRRGLGLPGRIRALWALPPRVRPRLPLAGGAGWGINSR
jgi:hypothetical protein